MRTALRKNPSRVQVSTGASIPAPVGGWDAQSPLAAMKPQNAVILDNWIPRPGYIELRKGFQQVLDLEAIVETVMTWRGSAPGLDDVLSCAGSQIFNGAGVSLFGSALTARWQYVNFSNDAGRFIVAINGRNNPQKYDGTAFTDAVITGSSGPITLDPTKLTEVMAFKRRLFFIEGDTLRIWFLGVDAIEGPAELLDLGPVFQKGGSLTCLQPWSLDGGTGSDDYGVFMTNQGEIAVYQGEDPTDATNWSEIGTYSVGLPLGQRALIKYGADLAILTTDGIVPLSQIVKLDRAQANLVALTQKIQNAFAQATTVYKSNFGWQGIFYQKESLGIFNVPVAELSVSEQYVQNLQTGAWCRFTGINAFCWTIANDNIYFGGAGGLFQWDVGSSDALNGIVGDVETAFNYFGSRGRNKKFEMIRPLLRADQNVTPALELVTDYRERVPQAIPIEITGGAALWGSALWGESTWGDDLGIRNDWTSVTGVGYCAAARMRVITAGSKVYYLEDGEGNIIEDGDGNWIIAQGGGSPDVTVQLISFDLIYQNGGQL